MKQVLNTISTPSLDVPRDLLIHIWKRKKPQTGYNRAYSAEFPDGTKVNIEYNFLKEVVKIEFYPIGDNRSFYIVIQRGTILQERDFISNRPVPLYSRLSKYKKFFSYLYDEQVLKTIGGCYDIPLKSSHPYATSDFSTLQWKKVIKKLRPEKIIDKIKEYLKQKEIKQKNLKGIKKILYRIPGDFFDSIIFYIILYLFYIGKIPAIEFSFISVFYGILTGYVDMYWRRRKPLIIKSILFSVPGFIIFWFRYQLLEWNIEEPVYIYLNTLFHLLKNRFV